MAHFDRAIPPGGEGKITLRVDLTDYQGKVSKTATVLSNDPENSRVVISLNGIVDPLLHIRPGNSISFRGAAETVAESIVELKAADRPFHISKIESNLEEKVQMRLDTVKDGYHYRLRVANRVRQGTYSGILTLHTDMEKKPQIALRVSAHIESLISVRPMSVLIGKVAEQQPVRSGKVIITSNSGKPFKIRKLSYDDTLIAVNQEALPNEDGLSLDITPRMEAIQTGARQQTVLGVETDVPGEEMQEVQVYIMNNPAK